ncbi:MAG: inactive transglutaminase family protein [Porticoccaceae bacterium]
MRNLSVTLWAALLIILGLSICLYKSFTLGLPLSPKQNTEVWTIQAALNFQGLGGPAIVDFHLPSTTPGFIKLDENFISKGFGLSTEEKNDQRKAQWVVRRARGQQTLYYRLSVASSPQQGMWDSRPEFPQPPTHTEPYNSAIKAIIGDVRNESADVFTYTRELLQQLNAPVANDNIELIRSRAHNAEQWVEEIINILKGARIPARVLWGLTLSDAANDARLLPMLQVHNGDQWLTFDPKTSHPGTPANFLTWYVGSEPLFDVEGGRKAELSFSVTRTYRELIDVARQRARQMNSIFVDFSLLALPVQSQNVYRLLLMVPLGALIVVFMRTYVGIQTFGTFMPILIALAFRETQLLWGIALFTLIVSVGLMIRFWLERLMLLLVPRLTAILIIVVLLMLLISLITNKFGAERTLSVALFPMVILAMTIERMSITWEENGARTAMLYGLGSLVVASLGYLAMTNESLIYLMFVFPELLLVALGISLWMGRYTGYRLSELRRFRDVRTDISR